MKRISETRALDRLKAIKNDLRLEVSNYERRAKNCLACPTPGACCLDEHFVNVRISRLEAAAIGHAVAQLPVELQDRVDKRIDEAVLKYGLNDAGDRSFACPLFEKGIGCLVHKTAKPVPCVVHACYESPADLPPDELQEAVEMRIDLLDVRTYGRPQPWLPLPVAIRRRMADRSDAPA